MKKTLLLLALTFASTYVSFAQVHQFAVTHQSQFHVNLETEKITDTIFRNIPVNYTLSLDLNDSYLKIFGENKNEHLRVAKFNKQSDGTLIGIGIDANRPSQTIVLGIGKGEIAINYPQLGIIDVYRTKNK